MQGDGEHWRRRRGPREMRVPLMKLGDGKLLMRREATQCIAALLVRNRDLVAARCLSPAA